jgi:hypothetical protein
MMLVVLVVQSLMLIILNIGLIDLEIVMDKFYERKVNQSLIIPKILHSINSVTNCRKKTEERKKKAVVFLFV